MDRIEKSARLNRPGPESFSDPITARAHRYRHRRALSLHRDKLEEEFTYAELRANALRISNCLLHQGIRPVDRIAILSEVRHRWGLTFFSILATRAVVMPLDPSQSEAETSAILANGKPRMLLTSARHAPLAAKLKNACGSMQHIFSIDPIEQETLFSSVDRLATSRNYPRSMLLPPPRDRVWLYLGPHGQSHGRGHQLR